MTQESDFSAINVNQCQTAIVDFCALLGPKQDHDDSDKLCLPRDFFHHLAGSFNYSTPLSHENLSSSAALAANRILFALNNAHSVETQPSVALTDHRDTMISKANIGIPYMEGYLFSFLHNEVVLLDNWTMQSVEEYFNNYVRRSQASSGSLIVDAAVNSSSPDIAVKNWLVQCATNICDDLRLRQGMTEGDFCTRSLKQNNRHPDDFVGLQTSVTQAQLFKSTMDSAKLDSRPHAYWLQYLNGSLLYANYFQHLSRNRSTIFRYMGAMFYARFDFIFHGTTWREALIDKTPHIGLDYFEGRRFDIKRYQVAFDGLIRPAIDRYGALAAREIVSGFEQARLIYNFTARDFIEQTHWTDHADKNRDAYRKIWPKMRKAVDAGELVAVGPCENLLESKISDQTELCFVRRGKIEFRNGFLSSTTLNKDEGILIEPNRLHGIRAVTDDCKFEIYSVGEIQQWL